MPRNERRNAHRYAPARDNISLGWWEGREFRSIAARLRNLSLSGALVQLEKGAANPAGVKAWICLADQSPTHWVQAKTVEVCPESPETPCVLRLEFLDAFPYESFKKAVWDDGFAERKPSPGVDDTPPPFNIEDSAKATNRVAMTESERIRFFLHQDTRTVASSGGGPAIVALAQPHPPTLLEAYRRQMVSSRRAASFPWMVVLLIGLFVAISLGLLFKGLMTNVRILEIVLHLTEA